jgi:hypothetical protein
MNIDSSDNQIKGKKQKEKNKKRKDQIESTINDNDYYKRSDYKRINSICQISFLLYKDNEFWVPPIADELESFDKTKIRLSKC